MADDPPDLTNPEAKPSEELIAKCHSVIEEAEKVAARARELAGQANSAAPRFWGASRAMAKLRSFETDVLRLSDQMEELHARWVSLSSCGFSASGYGQFGLQFEIDRLERERLHRAPEAIRTADSAIQWARSAVGNAVAAQTQHVATRLAWLSVGLGLLSVMLAALALA